MSILNWNNERWRTRDRLFNECCRPSPFITGNVSLPVLESTLLKLAQQRGFTGDIDDLWNRFLYGAIHYGTLDTFPDIGIDNDLYLDTDTSILYYFKTIIDQIYTDLTARVGSAMLGTSIIEDTEDHFTYSYIPIKALPIEGE